MLRVSSRSAPRCLLPAVAVTGRDALTRRLICHPSARPAATTGTALAESSRQSKEQWDRERRERTVGEETQCAIAMQLAGCCAARGSLLGTEMTVGWTRTEFGGWHALLGSVSCKTMCQSQERLIIKGLICSWPENYSISRIARIV